ncbi:MAG: hypothetical protein GY953_05760, partial [bacterium]|nr:hypothetical protein [bacterium]
GGQQGENWLGQGGQHWVNFFRRGSFGSYSPAGLIYTIEGHHSLLTNNLRFHDLFFTSQLPFGAYPRVANDKRHPGGINAMFFDGHARTLNW